MVNCRRRFNADAEMEATIFDIRTYLSSIKKFIADSGKPLAKRQLHGAMSLIGLTQRIYVRDLDIANEREEVEGSYRDSRFAALSSFGPFEDLRNEMIGYYRGIHAQ